MGTPPGIALASPGPPFDRRAFARAPSSVILAGDRPAPDRIRLERSWRGPVCTSTLTNTGASPARIKEIVLFHAPHDLPFVTPIYGEGFQMLSQTGGTIAVPADLGNYTDAKHYRLPQPSDAIVVYGLLVVDAARQQSRAATTVAFTSCRRFVGRFEVRPHSIRVVLDAEELTLAPGERWDLEELYVGADEDRDALLADVARRVGGHHPSLRTARPPTGWCSWYCFGPQVTAAQVLANLDAIAARTP